MMKTVSAVVVCAGKATRMGGIDKIFANVCGVPVVARTLKACDESEYINDITVVTNSDNFDRINELAKKYGIIKKITFCEGGKTRAHSVLNGVTASEGEYVAIMDGARPLIKPCHIDDTCKAAFETGAAALGIPVVDTLKRVQDGSIVNTVDRQSLVRIQTPQVFETAHYTSLAKQALETDFEFTDDCSIYEYFGEKVSVVYGSVENIKITVRDDLDICERLVNRMVRVGHGYDVHRLVPDRELWLCGEKIDFELGLEGHSDADVALHALTDAMLGAAAMGDIGALFPDTDMKYKNISSILLLKRAAERVLEKYSISNVDVTIIAQKPKLRSHIDAMRKNIADALGIDIDCVSVKATTEEGLGFTGDLSGISAHAVCALY